MKGKKTVGDRFYISPSSSKYLENYKGWFADALVMRAMGLKQPIQENELKKWLRQGISALDVVRFEIVDKTTKQAVGFCQLFDMDTEARAAKIVVVIGDPVYRYRGFGCEVLNLLCKYALYELKYHTLWCEIPSYNSGALSVFNKQGFEEIGVRTHAGMINGKFYNLHYFQMVNVRY